MAPFPLSSKDVVDVCIKHTNSDVVKCCVALSSLTLDGIIKIRFNFWSVFSIICRIKFLINFRLNAKFLSGNTVKVKIADERERDEF